MISTFPARSSASSTTPHTPPQWSPWECEETTASMEQLSVTVRQNADSAEEVNQVAAAAQEAAETGGKVADRAVEAMGRI